jgi:hypothetical protein
MVELNLRVGEEIRLFCCNPLKFYFLIFNSYKDIFDRFLMSYIYV